MGALADARPCDVGCGRHRGAAREVGDHQLLSSA
jgi:hypothetical protein